MDHFQIKPQFSVVVHHANLVELRQGCWNSISHYLQDDNQENLLSEIILSLQKGIPIREIAQTLNVNRSKIESVLDHLQKLNVLQNGTETFMEYYLEQAVPVFRRPGQNKYPLAMSVVLVGDDFINHRLMTQLNSFLEIEITQSELWQTIINSEDDWLFDPLLQEKFIKPFEVWINKFIVYTASYLNPIHATKFNKIAKLLNISWLHLAIDGPFVLIGPTFQASQGPCYDCFETRVHMNLRESESYQRYKNRLASKQVYFPNNNPILALTSNLLISLANIEISNFVSTHCSFTTNKILSIFLPTLEFCYHDVLRLPNCRTCGIVSKRDEPQLYFDFQQLHEES